MVKSGLEKQIEQAASGFALQIVEAIKSATLQELIALQEGGLSQPPVKRRGRKPGPKTKEKEETGEKKVDRRKNRVVKNYPKCAYPGCTNNRFPRGKGFCGEHWRQWKAGKIKSAAFYIKAAQGSEKK
jgi:hypothetical protein